MISVIGLGFVGLTTALGFSHKGQKVIGYDANDKKTAFIKDKKVPFFEADLQEMLEKYYGNNFNLASNIKEVVQKSDIIMLCVGTPSDTEGKADLSQIKAVLDDILENITNKDKKVIVIKSTIPPSSTKKEIIPYIRQKSGCLLENISIANNPEFLREGHAWEDFISPDRIVIGAEDDYSKNKLQEMYFNFDAPIHFVSLTTGEFIKYLSNSFLATLISYSNEMSMMADSIGEIDIKNAFKILHEDKRWFGNPANMQSYVFPGCGFGGYCLPKDTLGLFKKAEEYEFSPKILAAVLEINKEVKEYHIEKIKKEVASDENIVILGLSFKPQSDDIRQTPALDIIKGLLDNGYKNIIAFDPVANEIFDKTYKLPIRYATSVQEAIQNASVVVITTAWKEFAENKGLFVGKKIYDLRYIL